MNLSNALADAACRSGDSPAITPLSGDALSYGQLDERARRLAAGMLKAGLNAGDRIVLAIGNAREYAEIMYGAWAGGLCVAPLNARLHPKEVAHAARDCAARLVFTTPELAQGLRNEIHDAHVIIVGGPGYAELHSAPPAPILDVPAATPAWLFYTSGTTGRPKGAVLTHRNLLAMIESFLADSGAGTADSIVHIAPQSHAGGLFSLAYVAQGRNQIIVPTGGLTRNDIRAAFELAGCGSCFAVPTLVKQFIEEDCFRNCLDRLHKILFGGAPMYSADLDKAIAYFGAERLWGLYGQGEAPCTITHLSSGRLKQLQAPDYEEACASVGVARTGVAVRVIRADGSQASAGEVGEVTVQGDVVMAGYWNAPDATAAAIRDGWLRTGDLGRIGETGLLTLVDRSKDVIISGGSNIYPRELEEVLLLHPSVREVAVVGAPDQKWGERPIAFVVAHAEITMAELVDFCRDHLAAYKSPRAIHFVKELPKSDYGKTLKSELRKIAAEDHIATAS